MRALASFSALTTGTLSPWVMIASGVAALIGSPLAVPLMGGAVAGFLVCAFSVYLVMR